jgi:hypothetical protein
LRSLPGSTLNEYLRLLAARQVIADHNGSPRIIWQQLQHLDSITGIEVEYLIGAKPVHLAEGIRL